MTKEKIKFFLDNTKKVHLGLKNGKWLNGTIIEVKEKTFIFEDNLQGNLPIGFEEVYKIEPFITREE